NDGYSKYNAFQLQYQRRLSRGLQALASYAWSHSLDNASGEGFSYGLGGVAPFRDIYNPHLDYGDSNFDLRHTFSTAITYNIPSPGKSRPIGAIAGNWALDSLYRGRTALPVNVTTGQPAFGLGNFYSSNGRPEVVPNQPFYLYGSQYPGGKA